MDNPGRLQHKLIRGNTKLLDEKEGLVSATVSTEAKDRDGDIVRADKFEMGNFDKHSAMLADHNYRSLMSHIGQWSDMKVVGRAPKRLDGVGKYFINDGNEKADWGFSLAKRRQAAYSIGFIPDMDLAKVLDGGDELWGPFEFNGQELLEISHVTIPAHPDALQRMKGLDNHPVVQELVEEMLAEEPDGPDDIEKLLAALEQRINGKFEAIQTSLDDMTGSNQTPEVGPDDPPAPIELITPDGLVAAIHAGGAAAINRR